MPYQKGLQVIVSGSSYPNIITVPRIGRQVSELLFILESAIVKSTLMHAAPESSYHCPANPGLMKEISDPAEAVMEAKYTWAEERHNSSSQQLLSRAVSPESVKGETETYSPPEVESH